MKVLINALSVRGGGAESFLLGLLPHLLKMDDSIEYILMVPSMRRHYYEHLLKPFTRLQIIQIPDEIITSPVRRLVFEHIRLTKYQHTEEIDVHFRADEMLSPFVSFLKIPSMIVVHTTSNRLIPAKLGDSKLKLFYWNTISNLAMRLATVVIAVSHHARGELSGLYPFAYDKITVIYHGVNTDVFYPTSSKPTPLIDEKIPKYILSVSDFYVHKNFPRLIEAYAKVVSMSSDEVIEEHLVIVGRSTKSSYERTRILDTIKRNGLEDKVHLLDYVDQAKLAFLYQGATAYIFPSVFETFGLTPLEAMACGTPVACAHYSSLPEIYGDAVKYFDPFSVTDMERAMREILFDEILREKLIARGFERVQKFTWHCAASKYWKILVGLSQVE